MCKKIIEKPFK